MWNPNNFPLHYTEKLKKLFKELRKDQPSSQKEIQKIIRAFLKKEKIKDFYPSFWMIRFIYFRYYYPAPPPPFLNLMVKTSIRSLSGVVPLSVFTKPQKSCPYHCIYCPSQDNVPKSYFADEAAVMRAIRNKYDPFLQTKERLVQFFLSGHPIDKVDLIVQGGTFSFYPQSYRKNFIKRVFDALNCDIKGLIVTGDESLIRENASAIEEAQKKNEKAFSRMVGLTIETRPDWINKEEVLFLRRLGVTRIEMGVQTLDNKIYRLTKRGHTIKEVVEATKLLHETGFKITYHIMIGLPGSSFKKDLKTLRLIFSDKRFKPDAIKFYPTQVVHGSTLYDWYKKGKYQPLKSIDLAKLILHFKKKIVPRWVRIQRLVRDFTVSDIAFADFPSNFRQIILKKLAREGKRCPCIRCREIRNKPIAGKPTIKTISYQASGGKEFFIEVVDQKDHLLGFLRLRIPAFALKKKDFFIRSLQEAAIIRELHVYGQEISLGKKGQIQHRGMGKRLIKKAEKITQKFGLSRLAVIAGIGVRPYYQKLGFRLTKEGGYMVKKLRHRV